jgi:hypothetical protein
MNACLECGRPMVGRNDKKYCDDYCRSAYHNRKYRGMNKDMREINSILRHNRKVLERLRAEKGSLVSREQLSNEGFDFRYMTDMKRKDSDTVYRFCYDYGYFQLGTAMCGIVCREDVEEYQTGKSG